MPISDRFPEWRDEQRYSAYPFEDDSTLMSTTGETFGVDTFIDVALYAPEAQGGSRITAIKVEADKLIVYFGDDLEERRCYAEFDWTSNATEVRVTDDYGRSCGVIVTDAVRLSVFQGWGFGEYSLDDTAAVLVASCSYPSANTGVQAFLLDDGNVLYGDVYLVGDNGIVLECVPIDKDSVCGPEGFLQAVRVHAVGDPLFLRKICSPALFKVPTFLQTIVFQHGSESIEIGPGEDGNVLIAQAPLIAEDTILRISQDGHRITFSVVGEKMGNR